MKADNVNCSEDSITTFTIFLQSDMGPKVYFIRVISAFQTKIYGPTRTLIIFIKSEHNYIYDIVKNVTANSEYA